MSFKSSREFCLVRILSRGDWAEIGGVAVALYLKKDGTVGQFVVLKGENPLKRGVLNLENHGEACWSPGHDEAGKLKRPIFLQLSAIWAVVNKVNHFEKSTLFFRAFKCNFLALKCTDPVYLNVVNH